MPTISTCRDDRDFVALAGALALAAAALIACGDARANGEAASSGLAGRWQAQSETQTLQLRPRIRLSPTASPYAGTNLGGSVGLGSMTTTHIATEPVPVTTRRNVDLSIDAGGAFRLAVTSISDTDARCPIHEVEERRGHARRSGSGVALEDTVASFRRTADCQAAATRDLPAGRRDLAREGEALVLRDGASSVRLEPTT